MVFHYFLTYTLQSSLFHKCSQPPMQNASNCDRCLSFQETERSCLRLRTTCIAFKVTTPTMKKGLSRKLKVRTVPGAYLHLHHQAPLPPELDDVAVDVHLVLRLQAFQHGVDADVGACAPDASTGQTKEPQDDEQRGPGRLPPPCPPARLIQSPWQTANSPCLSILHTVM